MLTKVIREKVLDRVKDDFYAGIALACTTHELDMTSLDWFSGDQTGTIPRRFWLNSDRLSAINPPWEPAINEHSISWGALSSCS